MPPVTRQRKPKPNSADGSTDHLDANNHESAYPRPTARRPKGSTLNQDDPETLMPGANISTKAPIIEARSSTTLQLRSHLFEYIKKKITEEHEEPIWDEYYDYINELGVGRNWLGEGRKGPQNGKARCWDREDLIQNARLRLQARLEAVQAAIVEKITAKEDVYISTWLGAPVDVEEQPLRFTREEVAQAHKNWENNRMSLGIPLDDDVEDMATVELAGEQQRASASALMEVPSAGAPAEEQSDTSGIWDLVDTDSHSTAMDTSPAGSLAEERSNTGSTGDPMDTESPSTLKGDTPPTDMPAGKQPIPGSAHNLTDPDPESLTKNESESDATFGGTETSESELEWFVETYLS